MKILIAEDDYTSRRLLLKFFSGYGDCDALVDGHEALSAYLLALEEGKPYDIVGLDVIMPKMDGLKVLKAMSVLEKGAARGKIARKFMIAAPDRVKDAEQAAEFGCEACATKPINAGKLVKIMKKLKLDR